MIRRFRTWWHQRQRDTDMKILWPACLSHASNLDHAKAAFALHAYNDPAWQSLGQRAIYAFIEELKP